MAKSAKSFSLEKWLVSYTKQQIIFSSLAVLLALTTLIFALSTFTNIGVLASLKILLSTTLLAEPSLAIVITCFVGALSLGLLVAAKLWPKEMIDWRKIEYNSFVVCDTAPTDAAASSHARTSSSPQLRLFGQTKALGNQSPTSPQRHRLNNSSFSTPF